MKVIVAAPRSGSTFYAKYLQLMHPEMTLLGEYFQPYFYPPNRLHYDITTERLSFVNDTHIVKILSGNETDSRVWDMLVAKHIPVILLKRKNVRRQLISFGISCLNDVWVKYNNRSVGIYRTVTPNEDIKYINGEFKREWFDNFLGKITNLEKLENYLKIAEIKYYEDIINLEYAKSDQMPIKQNNQSDEELMSYFTNQNDLNSWIESEL